jgi:predicted Zn-dependent protease
MKKTFLMLTVVFFVAALCGILNAENFENKAGGVSIWLPDDWEIDSEEQAGALYADAPDGDSFCVMQVLLEGNNLAAALDTYGDALSEEVDDFTVTQEARKSKLNGMEVDFIRGEGRRDEKTWSIDIALIAAGKSVLMCAIGWEKDKEGKFAPLREKIFPSIKPLD